MCVKRGYPQSTGCVTVMHRQGVYLMDIEKGLEAVGSGMLFMIPFTVLAILAMVVLGWNAIMPFASAAVTTAAATAGTEAMKKGAQGIKNVLIPTVAAMVVSTVWMLLVGILP